MGDIAYVLRAGQGPAAGPYAQGWGPLRVWPGGLCLSRALGDFDVGSLVLAIPHIMQVRPAGLLSRPETPNLCSHESAAFGPIPPPGAFSNALSQGLCPIPAYNTTPLVNATLNSSSISWQAVALQSEVHLLQALHVISAASEVMMRICSP